jgi:hypothetical protein
LTDWLKKRGYCDSVILSSQQWLGFSDEICHLLGSISAAIGVLAILLSLGLFGPAPSSNHGENSWLDVAFGIAFLFAVNGKQYINSIWIDVY